MRLDKAGPWLYQRYHVFFDRLPAALGMAYLFFLVARSTDAFSSEWRIFIAGGVLVAGMARPIAGYLTFLLALAYPLYSISIYIAALALAVLIPLAFFIEEYLAGLVLVLAAPLLSIYRVAPLAPLLAGLWWAEWGGVLVGLGSAFWLKTFAGMCGATLDLTQLGGVPLAAGRLIDRFHTANSLQTLLWMAEPWLGISSLDVGRVSIPAASDSQILLLHVIELLGWGLAGYGVGLTHRLVQEKSRSFGGIVLFEIGGVLVGLLGMGIGSLGLPMALGLRKKLALSIPFVVECCWSGAIAVAAYGVYHYLNRPAVAAPRSRSAESWISTWLPARKGRSHSALSEERGSVSNRFDLNHSSDPRRPEARPEPLSQKEEDDQDDQSDIIMLDLD